MTGFSKQTLQEAPTLHSGEDGQENMGNARELMVSSLKIKVLKEKLHVLAVLLNVGVSDCQDLLLVKAERVFFFSSCHCV